LAAAVSNAGGLGSLGCADMTPQQVHDTVQELRGRTNRGFNLNFFVHKEPDLASYDAGPMRARLAPYYKELGLGDVAAPKPPYPSFNEAMLKLLVELAPPIVSFHFGLPNHEALEA